MFRHFTIEMSFLKLASSASDGIEDDLVRDVRVTFNIGLCVSQTYQLTDNSMETSPIRPKVLAAKQSYKSRKNRKRFLKTRKHRITSQRRLSCDQLLSSSDEWESPLIRKAKKPVNSQQPQLRTSPHQLVRPTKRRLSWSDMEIPLSQPPSSVPMATTGEIRPQDVPLPDTDWCDSDATLGMSDFSMSWFLDDRGDYEPAAPVQPEIEWDEESRRIANADTDVQSDFSDCNSVQFSFKIPLPPVTKAPAKAVKRKKVADSDDDIGILTQNIKNARKNISR